MDKRLKARWIKALRSGKYAQVKTRLKEEIEPRKFGFCCLGVLREIAPIAREDASELLDVESCGIPDDIQLELAAYNDSGKSFKWIASNIKRRKSL